jgi:hypothetical protein
MKRLLLLLAASLAACSSQGISSNPSTAQVRVQTPAVSPAFPCHEHPRFVKKAKLERQGGTATVRAGQKGYAFTGVVVWNHLRTTTIQAYPIGGAEGSEVLTILPGHAEQETLSPAARGITVVMQGTNDSGPGVEVNATSCKQE